ncbi:hypothetical protein C446_04600 [Halobiforma nitratireducens JCM 10879]|uniref:Uncharacterized protein n=1 Tax=Halobiforma nitratireducens JCM 10879 TaxID=1227454 RepID=M0M7Z5_9EURY|nr:hypothetical protein C446_04600 [Halobiforma nitratireducens JCM 10879]
MPGGRPVTDVLQGLDPLDDLALEAVPARFRTLEFGTPAHSGPPRAFRTSRAQAGQSRRVAGIDSSHRSHSPESSVRVIDRSLR